MSDYKIEEKTTYSQLEARLKTEFDSSLSGLENLESLKKAFRIINGVEDLQTPENLSDEEREIIVKNAQGVSDAMARTIQAYVANKLAAVRSELEAEARRSDEMTAAEIAELMSSIELYEIV